MANYTAVARTNPFPVKNAQTLRDAITAHGVPFEVGLYMGAEFTVTHHTDKKGQDFVTLFCDGPWPSFDPETVAERLDIELDDDGEPLTPLPSKHESLHEVVAEHLVEGAVAIFMEIGNETTRYLGGTALAVNAIGETRRVDLDDIYELAKELTDSDTPITLAVS